MLHIGTFELHLLSTVSFERQNRFCIIFFSPHQSQGCSSWLLFFHSQPSLLLFRNVWVDSKEPHGWGSSCHRSFPIIWLWSEMTQYWCNIYNMVVSLSVFCLVWHLILCIQETFFSPLVATFPSPSHFLYGCFAPTKAPIGSHPHFEIIEYFCICVFGYLYLCICICVFVFVSLCFCISICVFMFLYHVTGSAFHSNITATLRHPF